MRVEKTGVRSQNSEVRRGRFRNFRFGIGMKFEIRNSLISQLSTLNSQLSSLLTSMPTLRFSLCVSASLRFVLSSLLLLSSAASAQDPASLTATQPTDVQAVATYVLG